MASNRTSPLSSPARSYDELFDEEGEPLFNLTNTSMEEMIKPYYSGNKNLDAEVEKARRYAELTGGDFYEQAKQFYGKIKDPVLTQFNRETSDFAPEGPEVDGKKWPFVRVSGKEGIAEDMARFEEYKAGKMSEEDKKKFEKFMSGNGLTPETFGDFFGKKRVPSTLEHEIGHYATRPFVENNGERMYAVKNANEEGKPDNYMAKPSELVNVVGRIQRERFQKGEGRFEDKDALKDYVKKTPYEKAIQGYSPEAIRGWKALYEEQDASKPDVKWLLDYASQLAPAMVRNSRKTGLGSYS